MSTNAFRGVSKDPYQQVLNFHGRQLVQMPVLQAKNRLRCEKALYKEVLVSKYCVYQCISMSKLGNSSVVSNWWLMPMIIRNIVKLSDRSLHWLHVLICPSTERCPAPVATCMIWWEIKHQILKQDDVKEKAARGRVHKIATTLSCSCSCSKMAQVFTLTTLGSVGSGWWCRVYGHVYVPVAGWRWRGCSPLYRLLVCPHPGSAPVSVPAQRRHGSRQLAATPSRRALLH